MKAIKLPRKLYIYIYIVEKRGGNCRGYLKVDMLKNH